MLLGFNYFLLYFTGAARQHKSTHKKHIEHLILRHEAKRLRAAAVNVYSVEHNEAAADIEELKLLLG
jgi:hypothetical protein